MQTDYSMAEIMPIVAELSAKYTRRQSSSIPFELARQLTEAVLYCIRENDSVADNSAAQDRRSQAQPSPPQQTEHAIPAALMAYRSGRQRVLDKVIRSQALYEELLANFRSFGNIAYRDTVEQGLLAFFQYYDVEFAPQDTIITMDYPVLGNLQNLQGADAIYEYLNSLRLEQAFLKPFPEDYVRATLIQHHRDCDALLLNPCSLVLRNVLGCMIAGRSVASGRFTEEEYRMVELFLAPFSVSLPDCCSLPGHDLHSLKLELERLLLPFMQTYYPDEPLLFDYLKLDLPDFAAELITSARYGNLSRFF